MSLSSYADLLGIPLGTLRDWERGTRLSKAAKILLLIAEKRPEVLRDLS